MQEKYNITWPSYSDHLKNMMKELMMNEDFSDVTLVTEDKKQIKANIHILTACSPVFKDILKKNKNSSPIMYLRGIQYTELESIMQFIYLGEATLYKERMEEFLAVARSLKIKQLCDTETEPEDYSTKSDQNTSTEFVEEQTVMPDDIKKQVTKEGQGSAVRRTGKYECVQCHKTYTDRTSLRRHKRSVHEGVKYACDKCDYQAKQQGNLTLHIQSKHKDVKYACDQCEYQATQQGHLTSHIQSRHKGVKYACGQCSQQFTNESNLTKHIQSMHEGVRYVCDLCGYQATQQSSLKRHIQSKVHDGLKLK